MKHLAHACRSPRTARASIAARASARATLATVGSAVLLSLGPTRAGAALEPMDLPGAESAITSLDVDRAKSLLTPLDPHDPRVGFQWARWAMTTGDCDEASRRLADPAVRVLADAGSLGEIARTCSRAMAGAITVDDPHHQVRVRFQDEVDRALLEVLGETAAKQREILVRDLGVELPLPIRIDVVRDQFSLAAMTGLPHQAAQTTGTVAIAKWGRVIMLSPQAPNLGYAFRDTLAHELTHLALARGTLDRAPLWLQEGVAKREELRWRRTLPPDEISPADAVAAAGLERGLGRPLDGIGPSVALLPSAQEAMVVYAEVSSFVGYLAGDRAGTPGAPHDPTVLPKLVATLARTPSVDAALVEVTGKNLKAWNAQWRPWVATRATPLPAALGLGPARPNAPKGAPNAAHGPSAAQELRDQKDGRDLRLAQLLLGRGHAPEARQMVDMVLPGHPGDPLIAAWTGIIRLSAGDSAGARKAVGEPSSVLGHLGVWWLARAQTQQANGAPAADIQESYGWALANDPLHPEVACGWASSMVAGAPGLETWLESAAHALCDAARGRGLPTWGRD